MKYSFLNIMLIFSLQFISFASGVSPEKTYSQSKSRVAQLKKSCRQMSPHKAAQRFAYFVVGELIPHWIGTPWDFNGVSETPAKGKIACGYFVTTVLRDAGVKINRIKMAQCASETMIHSLTNKKVNYSGLPFETFIAKVKARGIGLSIIGLDNHTGFLYNDGKELWFIHSSFIGRQGVIKERARDNIILQQSKYRVVGFISQDESFMKRWMWN